MSGALRTDDNAASGMRRADSSSAIPLLAHTGTLSERVYRAILQMLGQGSLARGAMLRINDLSTTLGVSATPVREALARLAATGLVVHEARKGYRIAPPPSAERLRALMDARKLIEAAGVVRACRDGGEAFQVELAAALAAQRVGSKTCIRPGVRTEPNGPLSSGGCSRPTCIFTTSFSTTRITPSSASWRRRSTRSSTAFVSPRSMGLAMRIRRSSSMRQFLRRWRLAAPRRRSGRCFATWRSWKNVRRPIFFAFGSSSLSREMDEAAR